MKRAQEPYTGPFPRGRHSHKCCNKCGGGSVACYKSRCTKPQRGAACGWCGNQGDWPTLPTLETVPAERVQAAAIALGENLTSELQRPLGSIEQRAGRMEIHSPLFCNSAANPQASLFFGEEA